MPLFYVLRLKLMRSNLPWNFESRVRSTKSRMLPRDMMVNSKNLTYF